jgi:hypothetical protein
MRRFVMKKTALIVGTVILAALFAITPLYAQPADPGTTGPGYGYGYGTGPGMMGGGYGGYGMGPGMMGGGGYGGYGMGPGMMGPGYGPGYGPQYGPGYGQQYGPGYGPQYQHSQKPLDKEKVQQEVENYLKSTRNPNLKMGKIGEKGNDYEVDIETKRGALADKLLVDKNTGWMRSAY